MCIEFKTLMLGAQLPVGLGGGGQRSPGVEGAPLDEFKMSHIKSLKIVRKF